MSSVIAREKKALRRQALLHRRQLGDRPVDALAARDNLLSIVSSADGEVISGYVAMRGELDPRPALLAMEARGCRIALPYTVGQKLPLQFLAAPGANATSTDAYGIAAPDPGAEQLSPDILIVPLAAFDRQGFRLGYGGGFYDAALARLRESGKPLAIGWAFAAQEVDAVPKEPHDARLDWIVTEKEAIYISA